MAKTLKQYLEELNLANLAITPEGDIDFSDPKTVKALEALSGEGIKPFKIKIPGVNLFKCNPDGGGGMNIGDCRTKNECPNTNCPCEPKPEDSTTPQGLVKKTKTKKR